MDGVGPGESVRWPTGIGGKGNDGVAAFVKQTSGAIGYVEFAYARQAGSSTVLLQNVDGQFVAPSAASFAAAANGADWQNAKGNYLLLLDQGGANTWPITGATFILVDRQPIDAKHVRGVLTFFDWTFTSGAASATSLDYVPLEPRVQELIRAQWATAITSNGKPI
jgi:phosphate transport system substrate-binding protein